MGRTGGWKEGSLSLGFPIRRRPAGLESPKKSTPAPPGVLRVGQDPPPARTARRRLIPPRPPFASKGLAQAPGASSSPLKQKAFFFPKGAPTLTFGPSSTGRTPWPAAGWSGSRKTSGGGKRAVDSGAGRLSVWAWSPASYLTAPTAHSVVPRARIGSCPMSRLDLPLPPRGQPDPVKPASPPPEEEI